MTAPNYQRALEALYGLERGGGALGLRGTELLLHGLGHPQERFRAVHVAGTNGKGSVSAFLERILRAGGLRTGLFTSPHLVDYRERMRVSGRAIAPHEVGDGLARVRALPDAAGRTFFEVTTAIGFDHFARAGVEWAVVEVGLGGRLDSTNVLRPALSVVSEIGLDHTELLGATLAEVSREKAGIVKPGVPVVSGPRRREAAEVLARAAREQGAPLLKAPGALRVHDVRLSRFGARFTLEGRPWGRLRARIGMRGAHQVRNALSAATAAAALAASGVPLTAVHLAEGLEAARWPGRLEPCPADERLWWDGAHNPDGMSALARAWREIGLPEPRALVFSCSRDKRADLMLRILRRLAPAARLHAAVSSSERSAPAEELAEQARRAGLRAEAHGSVSAALEAALGGRRPPVLLCGSLFAVGDAMAAMGCPPPEAL